MISTVDFISEIVHQWQEYHDTLSSLLDEINDTFTTKCWYDNSWQYHEEPYIPDEQTPYLQSLAQLLKPVVEFTSNHLNELNKLWDLECEAQINAEKAFESWKRNLCPLAMKDVPRYMSVDSFNRFETYDEIAQYLTSSEINYEGTKKAISLWQSKNTKNAA